MTADRDANRGDALLGATIAFDLDGTLVDTAPDLVGTLNLLLGQEGLPPLAFHDARRLIGQGPRRMVERGFEAAGAPLSVERLDMLFERFLAEYGPRMAEESRPFPGVSGALRSLRAGGARLAVCTNKPTALSMRLLEAVGLAPFFDAVVGPDTAGARKPDPRHLEAAARAAGGSLSRAVMVGDASTDAQVARAAGAALILVGFGYADVAPTELAPDALIDHFDELPGACMRLLGACGAGT